MAAVESPVRPPAKRPSAGAAEPVWVFESRLDGNHRSGAAALGRACHGAVEGQGSGFAGNSYALPTRDDDDALLPWATIEEHVQAFRTYLEAHPQRGFRILPSAQRKSDDEHLKFADLLRNVPGNCELPGRTLDLLERLDEVRIILLDANVREIESTERKEALDQYFSANEALWNVAHVEVVSFGLPHTLVQNDKYARGRRYRHRIISAKAEVYGNHAMRAQELLSVARATRVLCINDPLGTSTGNQVGALHLAMNAGLPIEEVLIQV